MTDEQVALVLRAKAHVAAAERRLLDSDGRDDDGPGGLEQLEMMMRQGLI